jgi:hypothetical protein
LNILVVGSNLNIEYCTDFVQLLKKRGFTQVSLLKIVEHVQVQDGPSREILEAEFIVAVISKPRDLHPVLGALARNVEVKRNVVVVYATEEALRKGPIRLRGAFGVRIERPELLPTDRNVLRLTDALVRHMNREKAI